MEHLKSLKSSLKDLTSKIELQEQLIAVQSRRLEELAQQLAGTITALDAKSFALLQNSHPGFKSTSFVFPRQVLHAFSNTPKKVFFFFENPDYTKVLQTVKATLVQLTLKSPAFFENEKFALHQELKQLSSLKADYAKVSKQLKQHSATSENKAPGLSLKKTVNYSAVKNTQEAPHQKRDDLAQVSDESSVWWQTNNQVFSGHGSNSNSNNTKDQCYGEDRSDRADCAPYQSSSAVLNSDTSQNTSDDYGSYS